MGEIRLTTLHTTAPNTSLVLHPAWNMRAEQYLRVDRHRARSGTAYCYRWGAHAAYRLPLTFVPDDERELLHAWWRAGESLLFTLNDSATLSHSRCRIANPRLPLGVRVPGLSERWAGVLELTAIDGGLRLGLPFTLDDPLAGRLDDPTLFLL